MKRLLVLALVGCGGRGASDDAAPVATSVATDAAPPDAAPDAAPPPDAAPMQMLPADRDPWGPNAPRLPDRPRRKRPPEEAREMPEPADRDVVLMWQKRPRVRVHVPVGNWHVSRVISIGGATTLTRANFNPSWTQGNIDFVLDLDCYGSCTVDRLPANIVERAHDDFAMLRDWGRHPRWIVKPHGVAGVWSWRYEAFDDVGTRTDGRVAVFRILPELGAFLECRGETWNRGHPIWLDRLEALCRELTFEVLP